MVTYEHLTNFDSFSEWEAPDPHEDVGAKGVREHGHQVLAPGLLCSLSVLLLILSVLLITNITCSLSVVFSQASKRDGRGPSCFSSIRPGSTKRFASKEDPKRGIRPKQYHPQPCLVTFKEFVFSGSPFSDSPLGDGEQNVRPACGSSCFISDVSKIKGGDSLRPFLF